MDRGALKPALVALIASVLASSVAAQDTDFWSTPRRGTNSFNAVESRQHLAEARDFGAGFVRLTWAKWKGAGRDFLAGDLDRYDGLEAADVAVLRRVLDDAAAERVPIVLTPLDLPGARWRQNNGNQPDDRLWQDKIWWDVAARYWADIAREFRGHPSVVAYNILNEPVPELRQGLNETTATVAQRDAWCARMRGTARDLDGFYRHVVAAIRAVDPDTPIMLDGGWYAQPSGVRCLTPLDDPHILYAMHMYEPYAYTNWRQNGGALTYPGMLEFGDRTEMWDAARIAAHQQPMIDWADDNGVPRDRIILSEFGCDRRVPGCAAWLTDVIAAAEASRIHWAWYSFREDTWDGMDHELGNGPTPPGFYDETRAHDFPRPANPMSDALRRGLRGPR